MPNAIEEIKKQIHLLKIEQEDDRTQYRDKILKSSIQERKQLGVTWYPIVIKDSYYGYGERLILEVERPSGTYIPHQFQFGCTASLFSNNQNYSDQEQAITGVVSAVRMNQLRITLSVDELPEWADLGKLGINLLFDETSYKEMNNALTLVSKAENNRLAQLREILVGDAEADFEHLPKVDNSKLNTSQNSALHQVLSAKDVAIIHGPPGTGKTTTLVEVIHAVLQKEKQVLVCAPSNTAVDLLTEKLAEKGLNVLRFGNPSKVSESLVRHTVDAKSANHPEYKRIKEFKKRAAEFKNFASKYKRSFGREERNQRKLIIEESKKLHHEAEQIEKYILEDLLASAQVITATLVGSAHYTLKEKKFTTVFIDEAGQALEAGCWIPIAKAQRVVMAGDHLQLPPTIKSAAAAKQGLSITLLEKLMHKPNTATLLDTQYRMHEQIMEFSNQKFYGGKLQAHDSVKLETLLLKDNEDASSIEFIDTAGCGYEEQPGKENTSLCNEEEANLLLIHLKLILEKLEKPHSIGIISPYKAQVHWIQDLIKQDSELALHPITVNTIDGFQGQEKDIIYISLVRSNDSGEIGFLSDTRRMNVAMTRAKKKMVIIGDSATIGAHPFYSDFLDYVSNIGAHKTAWEYRYE